ncbi:membrane protein insertion efficiency factor YidD [Colwellia sp. MSW7]|uniref:Membrane protein insertion efficiency factor YidD n=1 Tax=Colwellia maritima TaxID=2912588 RepID=A0ABS9X7U6_9GAMM|nr:membrane protein insertion efficiency factor YidD [Colwellia maritima]
MKNIIKNTLLKSIRYYQNTGGSKKHFATSCNFTPTCSHYTYQAIEHFGVVKGVRLGLNRIRRCNDHDCVIIIDDPVPVFCPDKPD